PKARSCGRLPSSLRTSTDIEPRQRGRAVAFAARLGGFQLTDGLNELAVKVAFVADDPLHWVSGGQEALADWLADPVHAGRLFARDAQLLAIGCGVPQVVRDCVDVMCGRLGLVARDAIEAPGE